MGARKPAARSSRHTCVAVFDRQHEVEDDQVVLVDRGLVERLFAVARHIHGVGLLAQALGDEGRHARFVFHQQNPHLYSIVMN